MCCHINQWIVLALSEFRCLRGCIKRSVATKRRGISIPLDSVLVCPEEKLDKSPGKGRNFPGFATRSGPWLWTLPGTRLPHKALHMTALKGTFALLRPITSILSSADGETLLRTWKSKEPAVVPQGGRLPPVPHALTSSFSKQ